MGVLRVEVIVGSSQRCHEAFEKSSAARCCNDVPIMSFKHLAATWCLLVWLHRDCSKWEEKEEREKEEERGEFFSSANTANVCVKATLGVWDVKELVVCRVGLIPCHVCGRTVAPLPERGQINRAKWTECYSHTFSMFEFTGPLTAFYSPRNVRYCVNWLNCVSNYCCLLSNKCISFCKNVGTLIRVSTRSCPHWWHWLTDSIIIFNMN